jgi:hypothetical protein
MVIKYANIFHSKAPLKYNQIMIFAWKKPPGNPGNKRRHMLCDWLKNYEEIFGLTTSLGLYVLKVRTLWVLWHLKVRRIYSTTTWHVDVRHFDGRQLDILQLGSRQKNLGPCSEHTCIYVPCKPSLHDSDGITVVIYYFQ